MREQSVTTDKSSSEGRLQEILSLLNQPHIPYAEMAEKAMQFLKELPDEPTLERSLAAYFELLAHGYAEWVTCYDYHQIHEFFFGAYLRAEQEGGEKLILPLRDLLW